MFPFATSNVRSIHTHVYQLLIGRVKRAVERGELRVARGISHETMSSRVDSLSSLVAENRAAYVAEYARTNHGVIIVSQDW